MQILASRLAGTWYAGDRDDLRAGIEAMLEQASPRGLGDVRALLVPHAGYAYSGATAAAAYREVRGASCDRVILLGPSHRIPLVDQAVIPRAAALRTILGDAPLDTAAASRRLAQPGFDDAPEALPGEHSVEIQFPWLQVVLPGVPVLPIVVGRLSERAVAALADGLRREWTDRTLLVVSSDFTHYGQAFGYVPFAEPPEEALRALDLGAFACIENHDAQGFRAYLARTGATICGSDPIHLLLALMRKNQVVHRLAYTTSGRLTGDWSHTVSYLAAAVTGPSRAPAAEDPAP